MKHLWQRVASLTLAIGISVCMARIAQADSITIDLSGQVNYDLTTYTGGGNYPQHGGPLTVAGVPFTLSTLNSDTGVIQSQIGDGQSQTFSINVGLFGVTQAFSLANSAFGTCGTEVGELDFVGSTSTFVYKFKEGSNIRDHFNGDFCNTLTDAQGMTFGPDRLDMQTIDLPAAFANQTLESIDFKSFGEGFGGAPFLAALTLDPVSAVPEPAAWPLGLIALLAVPLVRWRRRLHL